MGVDGSDDFPFHFGVTPSHRATTPHKAIFESLEGWEVEMGPVDMGRGSHVLQGFMGEIPKTVLMALPALNRKKAWIRSYRMLVNDFRRNTSIDLSSKPS